MSENVQIKTIMDGLERFSGKNPQLLSKGTYDSQCIFEHSLFQS